MISAILLYTDRMLDDLAARLARLRRHTPPTTGRHVPHAQARDARWTEPELVGEVEFRNWTPDGRMRHPTWRGLRPDRDPAEVELAQPP